MTTKKSEQQRRLIAGKVEAALEQLTDSVALMADHWRLETLLPFCRKHRLTYVAGNGETTFRRANGTRVDPWDPLLADVMPVIDIELWYNNVFGYYVERVTAKDIA